MTLAGILRDALEKYERKKLGMLKPDQRCDEACMFICSGEAKQKIETLRQRVQELETYIFNELRDMKIDHKEQMEKPVSTKERA